MFYWPIENPRVRSDSAGSGTFGARRTKWVDDEKVVYPHRGTAKRYSTTLESTYPEE